MASTLFLAGRVIATPGSYTQIDASGLESTGVGATGIVAIVGSAEGGRPVSAGLAVDDFMTATRPEKVRSLFRSGDLREAGAMVFEPSKDEDIPAGAQSVVFMKTNQATQASRTFANTNGTALTVTSADYGEFTNQISVQQANGTNQGKSITVVFEDTTESADDIGGTDPIELVYREPAAATGWDTAYAQILSTGIRINATRREAGLSTDMAAAVSAGDILHVVSNNAGDTSQSITIYGLDTNNLPVRETLALNGTTAVDGTQTWNAVFGATLSASCAGTVTVTDTTGSTTIFTMLTTVLKKGVVLGSTMFVANQPVVLAASTTGPASDDVIIWGKNAAGQTASERVELPTAALNTYYPTTTAWSQIDVIVLGGFVATTSLLIAAVAVETVNTTQNTLAKAAAFINGRQVASPTPGDPNDGFEMTINTGNVDFLVADMDLTAVAPPSDNADPTQVLPSGTSIKTTPVAFQSDLDALISWFDDNSQLVDAERIAFSPKIVDITVTTNATTSAIFDGFTVSVGAAGTVASTATALIAKINGDPRARARVVASAGASGVVRITARTPKGFTLGSLTNCTQAAVQSTAGVGAVPSNSGPDFLTGGSEGTSTFSNYQTALNLLKKKRVNSIVVLSGDPAVHAALDAHCAYMCGVGRAERDGFVGLMNDELDDLPTKTQAKTQVVALNSRHIRAFAQSIDRFNTAGTRTTFLSPFQAVIAAGMQAGAPIATPLTHKAANVLDVNQDASWNTVDDSEEMIQGGVCFMERLDSVGCRIVRNVTTWLKSNNLAYTEGSVNQAVNFAVYEFRTHMERQVGKRGLGSTVNDAKASAVAKLGELITAGAIVAWRALSIELVGDVLEVSVEMAPTLPINFVKTTIHLVTVRQAA